MVTAHATWSYSRNCRRRPLLHVILLSLPCFLSAYSLCLSNKGKKNPKTNVSFKLETSKSEQQVYESEQLVQEDALFFNTR